MVKVRVYVEGGGDQKPLRTACRQGFFEFFKRAGFAGRMPRIVACGSRNDAYEAFRTACGDREGLAVLLVDSEAPISAASPWEHVRQLRGDGWKRPEEASDEDLHFMVECMESWFLADQRTLASFFGQNFRASSLPPNPKVEEVSKSDVHQGLKNATKNTKKGAYGKGAHSFEILALLDPAKVTGAAPYADRLINYLDGVL